MVRQTKLKFMHFIFVCEMSKNK